jgi:hypothetical protein
VRVSEGDGSGDGSGKAFDNVRQHRRSAAGRDLLRELLDVADVLVRNAGWSGASTGAMLRDDLGIPLPGICGG